MLCTLFRFLEGTEAQALPRPRPLAWEQWQGHCPRQQLRQESRGFQSSLWHVSGRREGGEVLRRCVVQFVAYGGGVLFARLSKGDQ